MEKIEFFKQEAKKLYKDYKTRVYDENEGVYKYSPRFFIDIDEILRSCNIDGTSFTLMNAQHVISKLSGFYKWNELLKASESTLQIGILLLQNRILYNETHRMSNTPLRNVLLDDWKTYEKYYLKDANDDMKLDAFKEKFLDFKYLKGATLYYNPIEVPSMVRIKSSILGINGEFEVPEFPLSPWIKDLIKLVNSGQCEMLECYLTSTNFAYIRSKGTNNKANTITGWLSLKGIKNGGSEDPLKAYMRDHDIKVSKKY